MIDQDPAWLAWRRHGIGASDIAAAVTGKYGGAYAVVDSKLRDTSADFHLNEFRMELGLRWEERIADFAWALTGLYVLGEQTLAEHPDRPWMRATIDGFLSRQPEATTDDLAGVLEIKTRHPNAPSAWDYYAAQTQWQMMVTGQSEALLIEATIDDAETVTSIRMQTYVADRDRQEFLASVGERLWAHVQAGTRPEPDTPESLDVVKDVHAASDDSPPVDLSDLVDAIARHKQIREAEAEAEKEAKLLEARIRDAMAGARKGHAPGWSVSISEPSRVLTEAAEQAFLLVHPGAGRVVLDRKAAEQIDKSFLDSLRERVGARRLAITRTKGIES